MHGMHLKKRGRWWYYYRNRPARYQAIEARKIISFTLRTTCLSEARCKAATISRDLEQQWERALLRGENLAASNGQVRYSAAVETNLALGFQPAPARQISDADLLDRLRVLVTGQHVPGEGKAVLGFVETPGLSFGQAFEKFWTHIEDEWCDLSHDQQRCKRNVYVKAVKHFERCVGNIRFHDVKRAHALKFRALWIKRKKEKNLKADTANRELDCLRRMFRVLYEADGLDVPNPFQNLRVKPDARGRRKPLTSDQIKTELLGSGKLDALHPDFQILLRLLINTGMRPIEAIGLTLEDILIDSEIPHVHVRKNDVRVLKNAHSERRLPLVGVSFQAARALVSNGGWGERLGKNAYATTVITKQFRANPALEGYSLYTLRHWFQDQLTQRNVVDRVQCQLMGHKFNRPTYGDGAPLEMLRDIIAEFAID